MPSRTFLPEPSPAAASAGAAWSLIDVGRTAWSEAHAPDLTQRLALTLAFSTIPDGSAWLIRNLSAAVEGGTLTDGTPPTMRTTVTVDSDTDPGAEWVERPGRAVLTLDASAGLVVPSGGRLAVTWSTIPPTPPRTNPPIDPAPPTAWSFYRAWCRVRYDLARKD